MTLLAMSQPIGLTRASMFEVLCFTPSYLPSTDGVDGVDAAKMSSSDTYSLGCLARSAGSVLRDSIILSIY